MNRKKLQFIFLVSAFSLQNSSFSVIAPGEVEKKAKSKNISYFVNFFLLGFSQWPVWESIYKTEAGSTGTDGRSGGIKIFNHSFCYRFFPERNERRECEINIYIYRFSPCLWHECLSYGRCAELVVPEPVDGSR